MLTAYGCASSRHYIPPKETKKAFAESIKDITPSDIVKKPKKYLKKQIHWIGILRDVKFTKYKNTKVAKLTLSQKYWDYVEDYSIQKEVMFLSNKGGGDFILLFPYKVKEKIKFEKFIRESIAREDLMFVYGLLLKVESNKPVLGHTNGRFVHEKYYSTNIWEYDIKRDNRGNIITNERGLPAITNVKVLKIPLFGEND